MKFRIALAQLEFPQGEPERNLTTARQAAQQAAEQGADILLLPELWASGYDLKNSSRYASTLEDGWFASMQELAKKYSIAVGGSLIQEYQKNYFNTFLLVDKNGLPLGDYQKIHLFEFLDEKQYLKAGNQLGLVDTQWGLIGLAVCYDLRFPELFRSYALRGAKIIFLVAEWPQKRIEHWDILLKARAVENQCFIAGVNKVGESLGAQLGGRSVVIDPMGKELVQGNQEPQILIADIEPEIAAQTRNWMPVLSDSNPDIFSDL